jgi:hypothetical protein
VADGAAALVPENDDQRRGELLGRVLDAAEQQVVDDVAGDPVVEEDLRGVREPGSCRSACAG